MPFVRVAQIDLERRSAKAEAAGAIPAVDAIFQDCGVTSSISPCEGDGPGANPGFLTIAFPFLTEKP